MMITPSSMKGFVEHGVEFINHQEGIQSEGICPWCLKKKFFVNPSTRLWDCKVCGISGNFEQFLERRMPDYQATMKGPAVAALMRSRGIKPQTFRKFGIGYDPADNTYMIPVDGGDKRKIVNILRYKIGGKCLSTSGVKLQVMTHTDLKKKGTVWLTEGIWDACALYEMLDGKEDVYSAPGAGTFPINSAFLFQDRPVNICFDNDKSGQKGRLRTQGLLAGIASKVSWVEWDAGRSDGFDVRDLFKMDRKTAFQTLVSLLQDNKGVNNQNGPSQGKGSNKEEEPAGEGLHHTEVLRRFREHLSIKNPEILDVVFGAIFANRFNSDPLWLFLTGPSGCGKTALLMSTDGSPKIRCASSITSHTLISGFNQQGGDPSLIPKLNGKVLVIKDFTTILGMNVSLREEIFSILRDAYDGKCSKPFGNGVVREFESKFGLIAGVTDAIEKFSRNTMLGERFIKYKMEGIDEAAAINKVFDHVNETEAGTDLTAKLANISKEVLSRTVTNDEAPQITPKIQKCLLPLAQLTAKLRGSVDRNPYTGQLYYAPKSEMGTRLAKQFCILARGIAVYRNEKEISHEVLQTVVRVAFGTLPDYVEKLVSELWDRREAERVDGHFDSTEVRCWLNLDAGTFSPVLRDVIALGIIQRHPEQNKFIKLNREIEAYLTKLEPWR